MALRQTRIETKQRDTLFPSKLRLPLMYSTFLAEVNRQTLVCWWIKPKCRIYWIVILTFTLFSKEVIQTVAAIAVSAKALTTATVDTRSIPTPAFLCQHNTTTRSSQLNVCS